MNTASRSTCLAGLGLFVDLYELTMVQAYIEEGLTDRAVFSLSVRTLPPQRNYLLACGLDTVLAYLEDIRFGDDDLAYLASLGRFSDAFLSWLRDFRFGGDVYAVPEGTPVFANEPVIEIVAPLPEAQLVETFIINQVHFQTLMASKASRVVAAAEGRPVADFAARRIHGTDSAVLAARAFHIAGIVGTSNVLAGKIYGLPLSGTMAHSYVQAHADEISAFDSFARRYPETILLVDTYDTLDGIRRVIRLAEAMGSDFNVAAVRLDSGDLLALSRAARQLLDGAGLERVRIFASGGLDEYAIAGLLSGGAPIDGFGVGTRMGVSADMPDLDVIYKLCDYAGTGRTKLSAGKPVLPGRKQLFRVEEGGKTHHDVIARADEQLPGRPLLHRVMKGGRRTPDATTSLDEIRAGAQRELERLPAEIRAIAAPPELYPVRISDALSRAMADLMRHVRST